MRTARSLTVSPNLVVSHAHPPQEQPHMPPGATMHTPQSNHARPPWEQPHPPGATTHAPQEQPRPPPCEQNDKQV